MLSVTLANWQDPPYNRWSFQHVRELVPTRRIRRGDGPVRSLPRAEHDLLDVRFRSGDRELSIGELLQETYTDGFLVLHRGQLVAEHYFNGMTAGCPPPADVGVEVRRRHASPASWPVAASWTCRRPSPMSCPSCAGRRSTAPASSTCWTCGPAPASTRPTTTSTPTSAASSGCTCGGPDDGVRPPAGCAAYFATLENDGPHGGPFRYRSVLTDVLGWVVEKAGGARLHELISREIWQPMGAEFDAEISVDAHGNAMADGAICATLRDLARFGQLYLPGSRPGLVPPAWLRDTVARRTGRCRRLPGRSGPAPDPPAGAHYRNCWWVRDPAIPFFHASRASTARTSSSTRRRAGRRQVLDLADRLESGTAAADDRRCAGAGSHARSHRPLSVADASGGDESVNLPRHVD